MAIAPETCPECGFHWRDPEALTKREREILEALSKDMQNKQIARKLGVAPATVESHRNKLFHKLGVHTPAGAIGKAFERGLLSAPVKQP